MKKPRGGKRETHKCSECHKEGHSVKTCPMVFTLKRFRVSVPDFTVTSGGSGPVTPLVFGPEIVLYDSTRGIDMSKQEWPKK